ncbi:MAG: AAA family ATPase [Candidatus Hodarchaeales archaeon]
MPGFELLEIEIHEFMSYRQQKQVNFPEGYTVITGPTGSGKTSLLDAITFSLFGNTARTDLSMIKTEDVCRPGGYAAIAFRSDQKLVTVKRGRSRGSGKSFLDLIIDDVRQQGKIPELNKQIQRLVGLSYRAFCDAIMVRQGEAKNFGDLTPSRRLESIIRLFRLDIFSQVQKDIKSARKEKQNEQEKLLNDMNHARETLEKRDSLDIQIQSVQAVKLEQQQITDNHKQEIEALRTQEKPLLEQLDQLKTLQNFLTTTKSELDSNEKRIAESNEKNTQRKQLQASITKRRGQIPDTDTLQATIENLKNRKRDSKNLIAQIDAKKLEITRIKALYDQQNLTLKEKEEELVERLEDTPSSIGESEVCDLLRTEGRLEERLDRINKELDWLNDSKMLQKTLREEQKQAEISLEGIREQLDPFPRTAFLREELDNQLEGIQQERFVGRKNATDRIQPINNELRQLEEQLIAIKFSNDEEKQLIEAQEQLQAAKALDTALEEEENRLQAIPDQEALLNQLKQDLDRLTEEKTNTEVQIEEKTPLIEKYSELRVQLEHKQGEHLAAREAVSNAEGELKALNKQRKDMDEAENQLKVLKTDFKACNDELAALTILDDEIFHRKGVPYFAIARLLPRLSTTASLLLTEMTDQRYTALQLERYETGAGVGLNITIVGPDGPRDVAFFSGGEKTQINLALRLAISMELARIGEAGRSAELATLIMDEADLGSLDPTNSQQLLLESLMRLQNTFRKILLITHLEDVARRFPNQITISIDETGRSQISMSDSAS